MNKKYCTAVLLVVSSFVVAMEKPSGANTNDWDAEKYAQNSSPQFVAAMKVLAHIKFNDTDDVIDIGSGDGKVTREIVSRVMLGQVKGIDTSFSMVQLASKNYADVVGLSFEHATITNYASEQKYNYAFSLASFAWIKEQQKALINIAALLKPGGKFVAGIDHGDSIYLRARMNIMKSDKWKDSFVDYEVPYYPLNEDKIKQLCEAAGLTIEVAVKRESPYTFTSREGFMKFMQVLPIQIDKVPGREIEFLNDIVDAYLEKVPAKEGGEIELSLSGLFVVARK